MTTTSTTAEREVLDDLASVQSRIDTAEVDKLVLAVRWAALHPGGGVVGPLRDYDEHTLPLAGPGAPEIAEFAVPALAVALGITHDSAAGLLGQAIELAHRLPRTYARVLAGDLRVWRARLIAKTTTILSPDAAAFVDAQVAACAQAIGVAALERLIETAIARHDPDRAQERRLAAAERRCFDIDLRHTGPDAITYVSGALDYADARDLETAVAQGAADLGVLGSTDPADVRRSRAVGVSARNQLTLDLNPDSDAETDADAAADIDDAGERPADTPPPPAPVRRPTPKRPAQQVVIHVHLADSALGQVEGAGCISVDQVVGWCADTDTEVIIKPVIDINDKPATEAYAIPDAMREQVILRDPTCVFPQCGVSSRRGDIDHITAWHTGSRTSPDNLAPLCRRHHRLKTHGGWTYRRLRPGVYEWTDPHGQRATQHLQQHRQPAAPPERRPRRGCQQDRRRRHRRHHRRP